MPGYDPRAVLKVIDSGTNLLPMMAFMTLCLGCTFAYEILAWLTARRHRAYASPLPAMGWFAIHDTQYVLLWRKWFYEYDHWWLKAWAVTLIFCAALEWALTIQVIQYGRRELMPRLTQGQFTAACVGALLPFAAIWHAVQSLMVDDLWLLAFAVTAMWSSMWSTALLVKRQSMRGQTVSMSVLLVFNAIGMSGAWMFLDPWFRSPTFLALAFVMVAWPCFNVWLMRQYPPYVPDPS